jgi:hypothetical protein
MLTSLLDERPWWVFPIECDDVVIIKAQALVDVPNKTARPLSVRRFPQCSHLSSTIVLSPIEYGMMPS